MKKNERVEPAGAVTTNGIRAIFNDGEEAARVLYYVPLFLKDFAKVKRKNREDSFFFGIEILGVEFSSEVKQIHVKNLFATNKAIIMAPLIKGETNAQTERRRISLLKEFTSEIPASQLKLVGQFYDMIRESERENFLNNLVKKYGEPEIRKTRGPK